MKRPLYLMAALVAIAFAGPLLMKNPDGTALLELPLVSSLSQSSPPVSSITSSSLFNTDSNPEQSFYKWQDDDGTWHYSDQAPADRSSKTVTVNTNTNLIQGLRAGKATTNTVTNVSSVPKNASSNSTMPSIPLPMTIPVEKLHKVIEDAHNIQNIMDNRVKQLEVNQ